MPHLRLNIPPSPQDSSAKALLSTLSQFVDGMSKARLHEIKA